MPRCCAQVMDPNNANTVVVYCELDNPDAQQGVQLAAQLAAGLYQQAFGAAPQPAQIVQGTRKQALQLVPVNRLGHGPNPQPGPN